MIQKIAVKALIVNNENKVLLLRKSDDDLRHAGNSRKYNLPGGKIDAGETIAKALAREVKEETGLKIISINLQPFFAGDWRPIVQGKQLQIIGMFFICRNWEGQVTLNDEHDAYEWVDATTFSSYDILPPEDTALATYFDSKKINSSLFPE